LLASVAILYGPLQVISFQAILAVSLVIGAITYVLNKQVRGGARFAYAAYLAAFSFAGLQTAAFHVGAMAERWGFVTGLLAVVAALYRYALQKFGAPPAATVSNSD
jgi:hypothetical protein